MRINDRDFRTTIIHTPNGSIQITPLSGGEFAARESDTYLWGAYSTWRDMCDQYDEDGYFIPQQVEFSIASVLTQEQMKHVQSLDMTRIQTSAHLLLFNDYCWEATVQTCLSCSFSHSVQYVDLVVTMNQKLQRISRLYIPTADAHDRVSWVDIVDRQDGPTIDLDQTNDNNFRF